MRTMASASSRDSGPMPIGLVVFSELRLGVVHGQRLGRHVAGADGDLVGVDLAEVVVQARDVGDVLLGRVAQLAGLRVDDA